MGNVLEEVSLKDYPVLSALKEELRSLGAIGSQMSGSGPTVFGLFDDKMVAERACEALRESHLARTVFLTTVFNNGGTRR